MIQSAIAEPEERRFRTASTTVYSLLPLSLRLPVRGRGALWAALALPPLFGVFVGTYSPILMSTPVLVWLKVGPQSFVPRTSAATEGAERITRKDDGAVV